MSYYVLMKDCYISKNRKSPFSFEYDFFLEKNGCAMVVCKEIKSNIERLVQRKTKGLSNRTSCQAGLGPGGSLGNAASMSSTKNVHKHETTSPLVSYRVILFVKYMAF